MRGWNQILLPIVKFMTHVANTPSESCPTKPPHVFNLGRKKGATNVRQKVSFRREQPKGFSKQDVITILNVGWL